MQRQVRLGGYYRLKWHKSVCEFDRKLWLKCRKDFNQQVNAVLKYTTKFDSPGEVEEQCRRDPVYLPGYSPWRRVRARVRKPDNEWVWIDKYLIPFTRDYLKEVGVCIIWTDNVAVGKLIAKENKLSYHGQGDDTILYTKGDKTIVCSIQAHGTGRDLQHFNHALVIGGLPTGTTWEQLLGRSHRPGQVSPTVTYDVLFPEEVERARMDAEAIQQTMKTKQKLLEAVYE